MARQERRRRRRIARWVESGTDLERAMYFSDAVFAIAITLLVLDLRLPEVSEEQLKTELPSLVLRLAPTFLSFVITFLVIGFYWLSHHRMFHYINRYDGRLLWINILFLMSVAFLPFPTSVLSQESTMLDVGETSSSMQILLFTGGSSGSQQFAVAFYAGSVAVTGLLLSWLWWYAASGHRLVVDYLAPRLVSYFLLRALVPSLIFVLSIGISLISPDAATFSWLLIPITLSLLSRTHFRRET
jgi:TMEM175 potassium channel family protein